MMSDEAFSQFYTATYYALYRYVRINIFDQNLIEDVVQETYQTAYLKSEILEDHHNAEGWLMLTAKYKILKMYDMESKHYASRVGNEEYLLGAAGNGESQLNMLELEDVLARELNAEERKILFLYYIEGYSGPDIMKMYNISSSCLKMRLKRIRDKLRSSM